MAPLLSILNVGFEEIFVDRVNALPLFEAGNDCLWIFEFLGVVL